MSRRPQKTLAEYSDEALALANSAERVKHAEVDAVRAAAPSIESEITRLLRKTASSIRDASADITYDDLNNFLGGRL